MSRIAFYISTHGLGHAMRMKEVAARLLTLDPSTELYVMGTMPGWVFEEEPALEVSHRSLRCDIGAIQKDSLHLDVLKTLEENAGFFAEIDSLVRREVEFIGRENINLIVGDIPPLAFLVAASAGVASIAVGNFSWDWIYEDYVNKHPRYGYLPGLVKDAYRKASLLLRLPFHGDMGVFPAVMEIPLISRKAYLSRETVRDMLGIGRGEKRKVVFISLGGHGNVDVDGEGQGEFGDYIFISYFPLSKRMENLILLRDRAAIPHPDIVHASDLVISKPGYCTIAECIANRTPLMYTSRDNFREFAVLESAIKRYCHSYNLPRPDFHSGAWGAHIDSFFDQAVAFSWPAIATDGADEAARIILDSAP